ncbi:MAG: hypothetical protein R3308_10770, partial [Thiohalobacterales bacterium]|nr:hypothetical protein [Thiohalobacterales bacterium]
MTPATRQESARHIVVTLEASESGHRALQTAARLAALMGAELEGVFVEDINLLRLAELPFLREVRPWSLVEEAMDSRRMQRELQTLARLARQMLEQTAMEMGIACRFQVWRGHAAAATLVETFSADILSLGRVSSLASSGSWSLGRTRRYRDPTAVVNVLFSGTEQGARALAAACSLAKDLQAGLSVLLPDSGQAETVQLRERAQKILEDHGQPAQFVPLRGAVVQSLMQIARTRDSCVFVAER